MSKLYFRYGAMNCGKSAALMQVAHNYEQKGKNVIVIKPKIDTKGGNYLESRIGLKRKVDILLSSDESIKNYYKNLENISCILVDESQFLSERQIDELYYITKFYNIPVICYGLKSDFQSNLFNGSKRLLELSDELDELITICSCGKRAKFNARYVNDKFTLKGDTNLIDGSVSNIKYIPLCGKCYLEEKIKYEEENK